MQPNNNLDFHLAGDENEIGAAPQNKPSAAGFEKSNNLVPEASSHHDVAVLDVANAGVVKAADLDEVDWIANLESMRHQRRSDVDDVPSPSTSGFAQGHINTGALKVTSMKTTELYQPAGSALAAGKDLDKLSFSLKEAQRLVKNSPVT